MKSYPAALAAVLALCFLHAGAVAQPTDMHPEWNVLYGQPGFDDVENILPDYLRKAVSAAHDERRRVIAGLQDRAEAEQYQSTVRERLLEALGPFPDRTSLNAVKGAATINSRETAANRMSRQGVTAQRSG